MADQISIDVPAHLDGARVDKALATMLGVSRAQARALLDEGVQVDGAPVQPSDRVKQGATIVSPRPEQVVDLVPEPVEFDVVHEDDSVIVVNKASGLVVHPGSGRKNGTLAAGLLYRYPELQGVGAAGRWGLVHRLDKDTSGVLLVARTDEAHERLTAELKAREIKRVYIALVQGSFSAPTGTIEAPIGRDPVHPTRRAVVEGGKQARTHYEVEESFPGGDCSLLRVRLETGRTHQIRVHLTAIDHPVVGDSTYGGERGRTKSPRTFLHALEIVFTHPVTGEQVEAAAPLPPDLETVLDGLRAPPAG